MDLFGLPAVNNVGPFGLTPSLEEAEHDASQWKNTPVGGGSLESIQELVDNPTVHPQRHRVKRQMKERITELRREIRIMEMSLEYRRDNPAYCLRTNNRLEVYYRELWKLRFGPKAFSGLL